MYVYETNRHYKIKYKYKWVRTAVLLQLHQNKNKNTKYWREFPEKTSKLDSNINQVSNGVKSDLDAHDEETKNPAHSPKTISNFKTFLPRNSKVTVIAINAMCGLSQCFPTSVSQSVSRRTQRRKLINNIFNLNYASK